MWPYLIAKEDKDWSLGGAAMDLDPDHCPWIKRRAHKETAIPAEPLDREVRDSREPDNNQQMLGLRILTSSC